MVKGRFGQFGTARPATSGLDKTAFLIEGAEAAEKTLAQKALCALP
jgi:hypothetical protein